MSDKKVCGRCKEEKALDSFPFRNRKNNVRHPACLTCWKEIRKVSYESNKESTLRRIKKNKKRNKEWYREYKKTLKCCECGENHPACLDFHHMDPTKKEIEISSFINNTYSINTIMEEIEKCMVLCANCHRKLHHNERIPL
jgi:hypothetical protein